MSTALAARGLTLDVSVPDSSVVADRRWLREAVANLILVVCKYSTSRTRIRLSATVAGDLLTITVCDPANGSHSLRSATGLELAVVRAVAEASGGSAEVETPDDGSYRVSLSLPV